MVARRWERWLPADPISLLRLFSKRMGLSLSCSWGGGSCMSFCFSSSSLCYCMCCGICPRNVSSFCSLSRYRRNRTTLEVTNGPFVTTNFVPFYPGEQITSLQQMAFWERREVVSLLTLFMLFLFALLWTTTLGSHAIVHTRYHLHHSTLVIGTNRNMYGGGMQC